MDKMLEDIINKTAELFQRYGIRSVTMDDIARELSISKKTLYIHVSDKKELVELVVNNHAHKFDLAKRLEGMRINAVEEYFEVYNCIRQMVQSNYPSMDYDLRKYYPEIHKQIHDHRRVHMLDGIRDNIERGIKEGFYRSDFNVDIITRWHILRTEELIKSDFFSQINLKKEDVLDEVFGYHLHAIATPSGIKEFRRLLKNKSNE